MFGTDIEVRSTLARIDEADPAFAELCHEWRRARGSWRNFPLVSTMTPEQLGGRDGDFCLFSVHHRPLGFAHVDGAARRRSHAAAGEVPSARPAVLGPGDSQVATDFAAAVRARVPVLHRVRLHNGGNVLRYDRLALPLSDDGVEIDYLLTFAMPHGWDAVLLGVPAGRAARDLTAWPLAPAATDPVEPRIAPLKVN